MTRDEILEMEPGQDLDLLIGTDVLHLSVDEWNRRFFGGYTGYSTEIDCAWHVVTRMENEWQQHT